MLAAMGGHLDCCVVLFAAGADHRIVSTEGCDATSVASSASARALLQALTGQEFSVAAFDAAIVQLQPDCESTAETLFSKVAGEVASRRREEQCRQLEED